MCGFQRLSRGLWRNLHEDHGAYYWEGERDGKSAQVEISGQERGPVWGLLQVTEAPASSSLKNEKEEELFHFHVQT